MVLWCGKARDYATKATGGTYTETVVLTCDYYLQMEIKNVQQLQYNFKLHPEASRRHPGEDWSSRSVVGSSQRDPALAVNRYAMERHNDTDSTVITGTDIVRSGG